MAQALFARATDGRHEARSAGSRPADHVHPPVVEVMREVGIDVAGNMPHKLDQDDMRWADVVVTVGCGDECPYVRGTRYIDWELDDPAGRPLDDVRGRARRDRAQGRRARRRARRRVAPTPLGGQRSEPASSWVRGFTVEPWSWPRSLVAALPSRR